MSALPFFRLHHADLRVHGWTYNGSGVTALHCVGRGRYLRRYRNGWTATPARIEPTRFFLTEDLARDAFVNSSGSR